MRGKPPVFSRDRQQPRSLDSSPQDVDGDFDGEVGEGKKISRASWLLRAVKYQYRRHSRKTTTTSKSTTNAAAGLSPAHLRCRSTEATTAPALRPATAAAVSQSSSSSMTCSSYMEQQQQQEGRFDGLSSELLLEVGHYMDTRDLLAWSQTCRRTLSQRDHLLAVFLSQRHQLSLDPQAEPFLRSPRAVLALTQFVQGCAVPCERAALSTNGSILRSFRFYEERAVITRVHASWKGLVLYSEGGGDEDDDGTRKYHDHRPPAHLVPLPWKYVMGWITILKCKPHRHGSCGQLKVVARGPGDTSASYITITIRSPQLLHCRMILHCESQARSIKGNWLFGRHPHHHHHHHHVVQQHHRRFNLPTVTTAQR